MDDVELTHPRAHLLDGHEMVRDRILESVSPQAKRRRDDRLEARSGSGVAARKERDVVTARRQSPTEPVDDPFRSSIGSRRNGFLERGELRDAHESLFIRELESRYTKPRGPL